MANNFELVLLSNQSIVSGDAESFCAGNGSVKLSRSGTLINGIKIKGSIWDKVATIKWTETNYSTNNIGYYDSDNNWYSLSPSLNWSGFRLTITNLNMPAGDLQLFVGQNNSDDVTYSNLEILDANGNSLLEATEPSVGLPFYIGDSEIQAVRLGDTEVSKIYIGNSIIYEKSVTPTGKTYTWNFNNTFGNPINNEGVISGFSETDMFEIYNPRVTTTDFEMLFDIVTGQGSSWQLITCSTNAYAPDFYKVPSLQCGSDGKFVFYCSNAQTPTQYDTILKSNITYQDDTNYKLLITIRNGIATLDIKDSNNTLIDSVSTQSSGIIWNYGMYVGGRFGENNNYFKGIFNSNKSYIRVNGNLISNITENT
jgi:hypothetical protein